MAAVILTVAAPAPLMKLVFMVSAVNKFVCLIVLVKPVVMMVVVVLVANQDVALIFAATTVAAALVEPVMEAKLVLLVLVVS
jgi:hypothetical protein